MFISVHFWKIKCIPRRHSFIYVPLLKPVHNFIKLKAFAVVIQRDINILPCIENIYKPTSIKPNFSRFFWTVLEISGIFTFPLPGTTFWKSSFKMYFSKQLNTFPNIFQQFQDLQMSQIILDLSDFCSADYATFWI